MSIKSKVIGAVLGAAVGDALGAPLEGEKKDIPIVRDMIGGGWLNLKPGQTTDDTAMLKCIAEMYVDNGTYDQQDIISRWLKWVGNGVGVGKWTRKALILWSAAEFDDEVRGYDNPVHLLWTKAGKVDAGNGSLMRCLPTGIFRRNDLGLLMEESACLSEDTHPDPRCIESCLVYNILIASLLGGSDAQKFIAKNSNFEGFKNVTDEIVKSRLSNCDRNNKAYVLDTLRSALADFWEATDFEEAMIKAVNRKVDADTVGCVLGGLLGAKFGVEAIPARWLNSLQDKEELEMLARKLV
jgi:ADP-ribosyl-[dinitrogen reductase] hydrolase